MRNSRKRGREPRLNAHFATRAKKRQRAVEINLREAAEAKNAKAIDCA